MTFQIAVNRKYTGKIKPGDGRFWDFDMTFENEALTLPALADAIVAGHAWTALALTCATLVPGAIIPITGQPTG